MAGTGRIWVRTPLTGAGSLCGHRRDTVDDPLLMDFTANPKVSQLTPFLELSCQGSCQDPSWLSLARDPLHAGILHPEQDI